ncbi:unnamed protein product [Paramecium pentaurelia]|uniref:Uncharacterized protein n=1 Tax=Paramecium pentaurelia TaxID=43138 RepID=A0A8S1UMW5_9CILI|nr:unnamed protein product [Paramecium pentaurelia]
MSKFRQEVSQQFHNNSKTKCAVNSVSKCVDKLACIQYAIACQCYIDNNEANCTWDTKPQKNADDQKNFITHAYVQLNLIKAPSLIHHGDLKKVLLLIIEMKKFVWEQSLEIKLNVNWIWVLNLIKIWLYLIALQQKEKSQRWLLQFF